MLPVGSIIDTVTGVVGLTAAMIAVGGFLGQVWPALTGKNDRAVREATVVGGLFGLSAAALVVIIAVTW